MNLAGYKINIQKMISFLYIKILKTEVLKYCIISIKYKESRNKSTKKV